MPQLNVTKSAAAAAQTPGASTRPLCVVSLSGVLRRTPAFVEERKAALAERGYDVTYLLPECESETGCSAGTAVERAVLFAHALTNRKHAMLWAVRGGMGTSEILPHLENMLPPVLPPKTLVGFSDISLPGCYLAARYPNFRYVHASHAFDPILFRGGPELDRSLLFALLDGGKPEPITFRTETPTVPASMGSAPASITGPIVPVNLSLAESLATVRGLALPEGNVLFVEDLDEHLYRILRKFDSLRLSGLLASTRAIILGGFSGCKDAGELPLSLEHLAELVARKFRLPVYRLPVFGHEEWRLPLVFGAPATIRNRTDGTFVTIGFDPARPELAVSTTPVSTFVTATSGLPRVHFTGVGGTGMAAVAGLFASAGFPISGSDGPIYPPMDKTIRDIGLTPFVGYAASNVAEARPDAVVLANVISRRNAELKPNLEFESLLSDSIPLFSFPSALRHFFLAGSRNIVVSGTHGKTTTTSLIAHLLTGLGLDPSFMVGGSPKNFGTGFSLRNKSLFVLEGDEYDSALFDKGPKFLHYEPTVALLNNIEFDHADIYPDVAAIEREFERLAALCEARGGWIVANAGCARVSRIARERSARVAWFGTSSDIAATPPPSATARHWTLHSESTGRDGLSLSVRAPWGEHLSVKTGLFGRHNALNAAASLAVLDVLALHSDSAQGAARAGRPGWVDAALTAFSTFVGVKRRFELIGAKQDITVFDDFAHHPTAIDTTLHAFRSYVSSAGASGRLVACFDPRNATMRRRVMQEQLSGSFGHADLVFLGKVAVDKRLADDEILDGPAVARAIGTKARYFADNESMCEDLRSSLRPGDTVVFMSSGAFDDLPRKLLARL